jgi:hypothetical protein
MTVFTFGSGKARRTDPFNLRLSVALRNAIHA